MGRTNAWIKSKSKTGKKPRTGNRFVGTYEVYKGNRMFILTNARGTRHEFESPTAARSRGWVKVL